MVRKRIFISSVQQEFANERKQLCNYIRQDALLGRFFEPFLFEESPAINMSAQQTYLSEVKQCDIYLALLGQHYGFEDEQGISPTEREFNEATAQHKYRICFIKSLPKNFHRDPKQQTFIKKVEQVVLRKSFEDYEALQSFIYASLVRYLEEKELLRLLPFDASHHPYATLDDIDTEKITMFIRKAREKRNSKLNEGMSVKQLLTHLDLFDAKGRITNAAILLFGKAPQHFFISSEVKCIQFYGNDVVKPVPAYQIYRGDLFELIEQALSFVLSRINIKVGTRDFGSQVPTEYELPASAVSEAIVNAIAHRDYTSNGSVQVMLFRNRLEILNPGTLPQGLSVENLYQLHNSIPVNPLIANPLFLSGDIEKAGTGTSDMVKKCLSMGLKKPQFIQDENFRVIIWRSVENDQANDQAGDQADDQANVQISENETSMPISERQQKRLLQIKNELEIETLSLLEALKNTTLSKQELLQTINMAPHTDTVRRYIQPLLKHKLIEYTVKDKPKSPNQKYKITKIGQTYYKFFKQ